VGFGAFISSGGDFRAFICAIVCALVAFLIWLPFIKVYDARLAKQEAGEEKVF